ncbi:hypothetical protein LJR231_003454 [Phyllobacterium sp. LjRoot231]|uniref:hypothetical protein n=1 Tax=Phyllobacterium sp. LjRoot231 TaxID=3342289 RepID=UPI003ECC1FB1
MHVGFGHPGVWGAGGSGKNAPEWLVKAFNGAPAGQSVHSQVAANQTAPISVASGAPAPALPAPINVGDSPVAPAQTQTAPSAPPPGILAGLMGGGQQASQGGDMSGILQMLMAEQEQPQPMQLQPMRPAAQPGQPGLAEYIQSFLQSRTA